MTNINSDLLNININKMKYYNREEQLNVESLKKLINSNNNMYITSNFKIIKDFEINILENLIIINKNHYKNINVFEKNIKKYMILEQQIALKFKELGDNK